MMACRYVLQVTGSGDQTIKQLLAGLAFEFSLEQPGYYLGGSLAEIDENSALGFFVGDIVIVQENQFRSDQKHGKSVDGIVRPFIILRTGSRVDRRAMLVAYTRRPPVVQHANTIVSNKQSSGSPSDRFYTGFNVDNDQH